MNNKIFTCIFTVFILAVFISAPLSYVLSKNGIISVANVGNIIKPEKTYEGDSLYARIFNGVEEGKRVVNDVYINYVPGYVPITSFVSGLTNTLNTPVSDSLGRWGNKIMLSADSGSIPASAEADAPDTSGDDPAETEDPRKDVNFSYNASYVTSDNLHRFYRVNADGDNGDSFEFLCRVPSANRKSLKRNVTKQAKKINALAEARPDINLYLYIPVGLEDTELGKQIFPAESTADLFDTFNSSLSDKVNFSYTKINTVYDKVEKYFLTDHHWNRYGSYEGYLSIVSMMQSKYENFGEARAVVKDYDLGVPLYGSLDLAINNYDLYDNFGVLDLGLPEHDLKINRQVPYGGKTEFYELLKRYTEGSYNKKKSYNHFMNFYRIAETIEYPENNTGRNLLFIGDSFSTCVAEAIASHFDKTYVRYVDSTTPEDINYSDYINENGITDVVILEMSSRAVLNLYGDALNGIETTGGNG